MKNFRLFILTTTILVAASAINVTAQNKPHKTSSGRAAYGLSPVKHKKRKKSRKKQTKDSKEKNPAYRKKYNWAG